MTLNYAPLTWNGVPLAADLPAGQKAGVAILGAESDMGATTRGAGSALAPTAIRQAYATPPAWPEGSVVDAGNLDSHDSQTLNEYTTALVAEVTDLLGNVCSNLVVFGGDDSISLGVLTGVFEHLERPLNVAHFDAHNDMELARYKEDGSFLGFDHASWLEAAIHHGIIESLSQTGVRAPGSHQHYKKTMPRPDVVVLDMDYFDPSCAPGVSVPEPFGPTSAEGLAQLVKAFSSRDTVCFVVTETNPLRDVGQQTTRLANRVAYEYVVRHAK